MNPLRLAVASIFMVGCAAKNYDIVLFHTNDRHSHFLGVPNGNYDPSKRGDGTVGGAARWAALIKKERATHRDTYLFSAGDYSQGTLFVTAQNKAADLNFMKYLGFSAAALGNHEFDLGPNALADSIKAAQPPPIPLLCANIKFSKDGVGDSDLKALYGNQGESGKAIFPYIIIRTADGVKIGVFGLMGLEASTESSPYPVTFSADMDELAATAQKVVDTLRNQKGVDVVIALAHLGVNDVAGTSGESLELARRVRGIDFVLSGHQHTPVARPIEVNGSTLVLEAGHYGEFVGRYELKRIAGKKGKKGELIAINDTMPEDADVTRYVKRLEEDVRQNLFGKYPLVPAKGAFLTGDFFQVLTHSAFDLQLVEHENNNLGYLVADAVRNKSGAQVAFVSQGGDLRESLVRTRGNGLSLPDAFISTPLGVGPDGLLGYPIAKYCLTLGEIKAMIEATTCSQGLANNDYMMDLSGLRVVFDSSAPPMSRIRKLTLYRKTNESDRGTVLYDSRRGYRNGYSPSSLLSVSTTTYIAGFLPTYHLATRDCRTGQPNADRNSFIVRDPAGREEKLWYIFASKLASFSPKGVPSQYHGNYPPNPAGPSWRRGWDLAKHPCGGHPYCR
ncbi:MAG: metallophosphoesterase [Pseudomonadota bacterium]